MLNIKAQTVAPVHSSNQKTLSEGNSVFVKVLKNNSNNSYTVAFSGARFLIKSEIPLQEGQSFLATIKLQNNKVILTQKTNQTENTFSVLTKESNLFDANGKIIDPNLASYFQNLSLIPDKMSYVLFEQMKMLGLKFNLQIFQKVRNLAQKFKGKEEQAAQIALILESKNITLSQDAIQEILNSFDNQNENSKNELKNQQKNNELNQNQVENKISVDFIKDFFNSLLKSQITEKTGILSLFNHSGFSKKTTSFGNWIKIPFKFEQNLQKNKNSIKFSGFICIFINHNLKQTEKCILKFTTNQKNQNEYACSIFFNQNKCTKIKSSFPLKLPNENSNIEIQNCSNSEILDFEDDAQTFFINGTFA